MYAYVTNPRCEITHARTLDDTARTLCRRLVRETWQHGTAAVTCTWCKASLKRRGISGVDRHYGGTR